jgi:CDP-diacylglycerol---serine O-phosphatidyltransferase
MSHAFQRVRANIPNGITCLNLLSGCLSIIAAMEGNIQLAAILIFVAAILDFSDGLAARLLKAYSALGKELDSLADVVSFGVAPGIIWYRFISDIPGQHSLLLEVAMFSALLLPIFAAIRLAQFNTDPMQGESFIGLPTPAMAIAVAGCILVLAEKSFVTTPLSPFAAGFMLAITTLLSFLMISNLPMFSLKFKNLDFKENKIRFLFVGISLILLLLFQFLAIPLIILTYVILSVINYMF